MIGHLEMGEFTTGLIAGFIILSALFHVRLFAMVALAAGAVRWAFPTRAGGRQ